MRGSVSKQIPRTLTNLVFLNCLLILPVLLISWFSGVRLDMPCSSVYEVKAGVLVLGITVNLHIYLCD